jgi:hypothetical protein
MKIKEYEMMVADECDIYPRWQHSVGCKCEYGIALGLGSNIIFEQ